MSVKVWTFSVTLSILVSVSSVLCQEKYTIRGKILSRDGNVLVGVAGVDVYIERIRDGVLVGAGKSTKGGLYAVEFSSSEMINATYGSGLYLPEAVQSLSGQTNHDLTKVLIKNGTKVKLTSQQSAAVISTIEHIQSNPKMFAPELSQIGLTLDQTMFPSAVHEKIAELKVAMLRSMIPLSFTATIVSYGKEEWTVRKSGGELLSVRWLDTALCGYKEGTLTRCDANPGWAGLQLTGRKVEIDALVNDANTIAVADRIKIADNKP